MNLLRSPATQNGAGREEQLNIVPTYIYSLLVTTFVTLEVYCTSDQRVVRKERLIEFSLGLLGFSTLFKDSRSSVVLLWLSPHRCISIFIDFDMDQICPTAHRAVFDVFLS